MRQDTLEASLRGPASIFPAGGGSLGHASLAAGRGQENPGDCYPDAVYPIRYSAYIPVDHLMGPTPCFLHPLGVPVPSADLLYMGDASSYSTTAYRIADSMTVFLNSSTSTTPDFPDAGLTANFGTDYLGVPYWGSPILGPSADLSPGDFDGIYNDCWLENDFDYASLANVHASAVTSPYEVDVNFNGLGNDPLEPKIGGIGWNLDVYLATDTDSMFVVGSHTCYPAHNIWVGSTLAYSYLPPYNQTWYLVGCLTGLLSPVQVDVFTGLPPM